MKNKCNSVIKNFKINENGITLVALVITIILLLILVGITINSLTNGRLLSKTFQAGKLMQIKEIEEAANLAYMARQIDEVAKGEIATIAGVISDLKSQGYNIEQRTSGSTTVTGIELNKTNVKMNKNSEETLTYTLVYGEGTVRYFAEIKGKYYEMKFDNGTFKINTEETDLEGINAESKILAKSNAENIITAQKKEGKDEIVINSLNELGEAIITIKEENSGTTIVCNVKVMTLIENITFNQETINIEKGNNVELDTLVTINPADATEELIWTTENGEIVEITEEGRLVGAKEGTTIIKVTNEDGTIEKICTVKVVISAIGIDLNKSTATINRGDTDSVTVTITPADTTDEVKWLSEDTSVMTITPDDTGRTVTIRALKAGTSKITVTCGSKTAYCTVTVVVPATRVTVTPSTKKIEPNETIQLTSTVMPNDTTDITVTWTSDNISVATVTSTGLVTGLKDGTAKITAKYGDVSNYCTLTVETPPPTIETSHTATDISSTYTWSDLIVVAKIISNNSDIIDYRTRGVTVKVGTKSITVGVGDTLKLDKKTVRVLGFNHDELVDTTIYKNQNGKTNKYAGISFEFLDELLYDKMNSSITNNVSWNACTLKLTLNSTTLNSLTISSSIKEVKKQYMKSWRNDAEIGDSYNKLWLLSIGEIFGRRADGTNNSINDIDVCREGRQYQYYYGLIGKKGVRNTNGVGKFRSSSAFLRTILGSDGYMYILNDNNFYLAAQYSNVKLGIYPGFCL